MAEDDVSRASRESDPPSFDIDDEAIAALLDSFVETQAGNLAEPTSRPPDPSDSGALAAQRTVFEHRLRHEALPLVGDTPDTMKRRIALLEALARRAVGSARARLLTSAGELCERLGEHDAAGGHYSQALSADARDVVVLRALRRLAMRNGDWEAAADALEKEAALELSVADRASALNLLARIQLSKLHDPAAAEQAAAHAAELRKDDFVACILLASARLARNDSARAADALTRAAERWPRTDAEAVLLLHAAELKEKAGALQEARSRYGRVLELEPTLLAAHLGVVRTSRGLQEDDAAKGALLAAAQGVSGQLAAALRRTAANVSRRSGSPEAAVALLGQAEDTASLWTLAESAALCGDSQRTIDALAATPSDGTPEIGALGWGRRARLHAERGEREGFELASREAQSEPRLQPYLHASKRLLKADGGEGTEVPGLLESIPSEQTSVASRMLQADEAARVQDGPAFVAALQAELDDAPEGLAAGAALAVAEMGAACGLIDRGPALLGAEERVPSDPMIGRVLLLEDDDPEQSARRWMNEGNAATGARSAFAFTMAARLAQPGSEEAKTACESALAEEADYLPALWELEDRLGEDEARAISASRQAALGSTDQAASWLRASMWTSSGSDRIGYAESALNRTAPDPLLIEHLIEAAGRETETAGELMELSARRLGMSVYLERAAASYRAAGLAARAARVLREASTEKPDDEMIRVQREAAELQASEFARLSDGAMRRVREATDEAERLRAFAAMAEVDRLARHDMQSARLSLQSIAELRPDHIPTARALEWDALRENDTERIRSSARRLLQALPEHSPDRLARHRLHLELLRADPDILQSDLDRWLCGIDDALEADPGLARQVLGAAYAKGDNMLSLQALLGLQAAVDDDLERGALALDAAHVLQLMGAPENALERLDEARSHPLAREAEAGLLHAAERWEDAAAVYQDAASKAKDSHRAASLWREAACIFEQELRDPHRAIDAWVAASKCDIRYLDVYRRLAALYQSQGRLDALATLTDARIDAGADTPTLVGLLVRKARQCRERGDLAGVSNALHECLELDPLNFTALKELVDTNRAAENWQGAAEALIRIARLKRSTEEQIWAFTQLASLYDVHLQDLARAEASLRRVAQLAPANLEILDRLASVTSRQGKAHEAGRLLEELVRRAGSESEKRDYLIRLAGAVESAGQGRQAEQVLEKLRAEQPTEPDVILALADYYQRQGATPAEAMHLNRALSDLRSAIDLDPSNEALWTTLVRVLQRRHGPGPASCAASAAIAAGHPASLFEGDVTAHGEALGEAKVPLSGLVEAIVAPDGLPESARRLFALCEHSFDKVLPFDASAWRLRRPAGEHRTLVEEAGAVAEMLGISEPRLRITYVAPAACMPVSGDPPTIVVGGNLHQITNPRERLFLFARALKVAANHLAPALRARPQDLDLALLALLQEHGARPGSEATRPQMLDLRNKLLKAVPRRSRDEVDSLALELKGNAGFSTRALPLAIAELGNRAALTLTGDVPSAVSALLKIAGHDLPAGDEQRLSAIRETPEAWAMLRFAIGDTHFEARAQAGVDP
jgi:tetratricopeptide (TPR) repeat protein